MFQPDSIPTILQPPVGQSLLSHLPQTMRGMTMEPPINSGVAAMVSPLSSTAVVQNSIMNDNDTTSSNNNQAILWGGSRYTLSVTRQTSLAEETASRNGVEVRHHVVVKNAPFVIQLALIQIYDSNRGRRIKQAPGSLSFHNLALDVSLLYDVEPLREVSVLKDKPVTFKSTISDDGAQVTCQCRLRVLTSQHEGSFFRIRVRARPTAAASASASGTAMSSGYLETLSAPYKVISKPEQLKTRQQVKSVPGSTSNGNGGKKRPITDVLMETVQRLEKQQQEHQMYFQQLIAAGVVTPSSPSMGLSSSPLPYHEPIMQSPMHNNGPRPYPIPHLLSGPPSSSPSPTSFDHNTESPIGTTTICKGRPTPTSLSHLMRDDEEELEEEEEKYNPRTHTRLQQLADAIDAHTSTSVTTTTTTTTPGQQHQQKEEGFEDLFLRCMKAYATITPELRPSKIRRVMRFSTAQDLEHVAEFVDLLASQGLGREIGSETELSMGGGMEMGQSVHDGAPICTCAHCPHRTELERIDEFYSEFLC